MSDPSLRLEISERPAVPPPGVRRFGKVNWIGLRTLCGKEIQRFLKIATQTVLAPSIMALLFLTIFNFAIGRDRGAIEGVAFTDFLVPGLIMMTVLQNAFANTSSSLMTAKVQGNIVDYLMPPLTPGELTVAFVAGGVVRGLAVAVATTAVMLVMPFVSISVFELHNPWALAYYALGASAMLGLLGMAAAIWAEKFDHMATVSNFVITPLAFLSGTFYSIDRLPPVFSLISHFNPFFYMIDGFRYGMIGHHDGSLLVGATLTLVLDVGLFVLVWTLFRTGYQLKA